MKGTQTKIGTSYNFWYRIQQPISKNQQNKEYKDTLQKLGSFDTVEDFWKIFQHIQKPESLKPGIEIALFKNNIKPVWEDTENLNGGRFSLRIKKDSSLLVWQEMIIDFLSDDALPKKFKDEINGLVLATKKDYNFIQIWIKNFSQQNIEEFQNVLRQIFSLTKEIEIDVKSFKKHL